MSGIFTKQIITASILISSIVLTACGGSSGTENTNTPPVAVDDNFSVDEGGTLVVDNSLLNSILANDSDAENNTLTAILVSDVSAGTLSLNSDGTLSYMHDGSTTTPDSFTYQASDGRDNSNVATVTFNINPLGRPVANADSYNGLSEGGILTVTADDGILANDSDPDNDTITVILVSDVSFGTLSLTSDGSFTYIHDGSENLNDSFSYRAFDGQFYSNTVTVSISVSAVNEAPVADANSYNGVSEGGILTVTSVNGVLANDSDPENNALTAVLVNDVSFGTLSLNSDGSFSYTHDGSENLNDSFSYRAFDGQLNSNTVTVSISVSAVNEAPAAKADSYNGVSEGGILTVTSIIGVLANDSDPENNALTAVLVNDVSFGTLSLNSDGSFSYTHDGSENLNDSFSYRAFDGQLNSNTVTVSISVSAVNEAPVAKADSYNGVSEGGILTVTSDIGVLANDSDPENNALTAVLVNDVSFGTLSLNSDGSFGYTHDGSENLNDSFSYRAFDGQLNSNTVTVSISVSAINDVPVANDDGYSTNGATVLNITNVVDGVLANDQDPDSSLTATVVTDPTHATSFSLNSDGTFSYAHDGSANYTDSFTYQANDAFSASNTATVTINVSINQPPVAVSNCSTTAQKSAKNGTLDATDPDNLLLTFSLGSDGSAGSGPMTTTRGSVVITNPSTGAYAYTPSATGPRGIDSFDFFVEDPDGGFASATETIIVDQKIMPLGDSITRGTEDTNPSVPPDNQKVGYRKPLYDSLIAAGYSFGYVGSDAAGSAVANFDYDNEGHSGYLASEIAFGLAGFPYDGIRAWLDDNPADIILLHIGTNDGPVPGSTEIDTEAILDEIDLWESSSNGNPVTVILAKIVNQDPFTVDVTNYNADLETIVSGRISDNIILVDMENALNYPADLGDQYHPDAGGYAKMAPVWYDALLPVLDKCP